MCWLTDWLTVTVRFWTNYFNVGTLAELENHNVDVRMMIHDDDDDGHYADVIGVVFVVVDNDIVDNDDDGNTVDFEDSNNFWHQIHQFYFFSWAS